MPRPSPRRLARGRAGSPPACRRLAAPSLGLRVGATTPHPPSSPAPVRPASATPPRPQPRADAAVPARPDHPQPREGQHRAPPQEDPRPGAFRFPVPVVRRQRAPRSSPSSRGLATRRSWRGSWSAGAGTPWSRRPRPAVGANGRRHAARSASRAATRPPPAPTRSPQAFGIKANPGRPPALPPGDQPTTGGSRTTTRPTTTRCAAASQGGFALTTSRASTAPSS